ncbi:MFS transporter [Nocardioides albertanoniae]|uniref:MFS transporter n=1 Tax=Nocardioides albertanoniae TaxID=1175486 RepID=UPI001476F7EF|nr:MFS transporter [Nocardioides albertanoniae]
MTPLRRAQAGSVVAFATNGLLSATFISRIPALRDSLGLSNSAVGLMLLAMGIGSVSALPLAGGLVMRWGAARVVRRCAVLSAAALSLVAISGAWLEQVWLVALFLVAYGVGYGVWDVAMNVEGAAVERRGGKTLMPQLHAMWSVGTVLGGLLGIALVGTVPTVWHIAGVAALALALCWWGTAGFLPAEMAPEGHSPRRELIAAWRSPHTLLLGLMVLAFAAAEGSANDWVSLAMIDGYDVSHRVGVACYAAFVLCMSIARFAGAKVIDRVGRQPVLVTSAGLAGAGILLAVFAGSFELALVGIALWGFGAALGFPLGISIAADDETRAAARVSVVSTLAYGAFLGFPPILGAVGDQLGTLRALLVVAFLMLPAAALAVTVARRRSV